jgi:hypothetical protein
MDAARGNPVAYVLVIEPSLIELRGYFQDLASGYGVGTLRERYQDQASQESMGN